jgi:hypothetical protein
VRPAVDAEPARWLLEGGVDWWDLVRYGPPGFGVYVRIALLGDDDVDDRAGGESALRTALVTLAGLTSTPEVAYAAVWEGWAGAQPVPAAPRVSIPEREMLLFTGAVVELRDAPSLAWYGSAHDAQTEPHLVWPDDRSWCLACEVDEEVEFSVGCSVEASEALASALPGAVRRVAYGAPAPLYREQRRST